ncbi:MAG: PAS domain-containing sensor histidine kinase [Verrucomicrobiales bacterium]|nr:PAS domain-containing sensor histidine kinase [Verrucomicrobiales bacterium]|tara:strand:- start:2225 stop:3412 length:1188 start_codon:yes stop_codon:yes gene_type:complete
MSQTVAIFSSLLALIFLVAWLRERRQSAREKATQDRELAEVKNRQLTTFAAIEARQQTLFNAMTEGVMVLREDGTVVLANEAFRGLFDLHSDIRDRSLMEAVRFHEVREVYDETLIAGQVQGRELKLPLLEDRTLHVNSAVVLDTRSQRQGMIMVFHDITRIKQLENTRREFVANVSHELRTPLSIIKGCVETLIDGAKDDRDATNKFLGTIEKHANRLTFLIEDLLTLSHLESGHLAMNLEDTELKATVDRVCEDLSRRAEKRGVRLSNNIPADLIVNADSNRLQQVLFNLIDNGIKYGGENGHVVIDAARNKEQNIEVRVADDGPGINWEAQSRLFERFFRADKARSREQGGTGLGLAIVKHIVQSHGGQVWVESEPGQGTRFHFTLRLRNAD